MSTKKPSEETNLSISFNGVFIIESLAPEDEHTEDGRTGEKLYKYLKDIKTDPPLIHKYEYIYSVIDLFKILETIKEEIFSNGHFPIIHLEMHGNEDSIAVYDKKGNSESVKWKDIIEVVREFNYVNDFKLILTMAVCKGTWIWSHAAANKKCPFHFTLSHREDLYNRYILDFFSNFYNYFLTEIPDNNAIEDYTNKYNYQNGTSFEFIDAEKEFEAVCKKANITGSQYLDFRQKYYAELIELDDDAVYNHVEYSKHYPRKI